MFCFNCGTQLPEDANFCFKCGKPQNVNVQGDEPKWETCEIDAYTTKQKLGYFWQVLIARVYRPDGTHDIGRSPESLGGISDSKKAGQWSSEMEKKLLADGWEYWGTFGAKWYQKRFRRRLN